MLIQNPIGKCDQPIAYVSWLLNNAKKNYTTTKREALMMVYALHKYRHYLLSNKFVFYVDHMAFLYLVKKPQVFGQIAWWFLLFLEYNFLVVYKPRESHLVADAFVFLLQSAWLQEIHDYLQTRDFSSFIHTKTNMEIDFKGFTLHIATRQLV
jgi:hypothetical protein